MNTIKTKLSLDATKIKIVAVILMFCDHIHQMWAPYGAPMWLTWLGRPVFPIFLFIMSESFHYTQNRKKLLTRLLLASWFMHLANLVFESLLHNKDIVLMNNAFSTFFITTLYMLFWDMLVDGIKTKKISKIIRAILLCFIPIITMIPFFLILSGGPVPRWLIKCLLFLPNVLVVEGGPPVIILGVLFYIFRRWRLAQVAILAALSAYIFFMDPSSIQWMMGFAVIPMLLYNGEKGRGMKNFFYIFYPAHIYLLYVIATLLK